MQSLNGTVIGKQTVRLSWGRSPASKQVTCSCMTIKTAYVPPPPSLSSSLSFLLHDFVSFLELKLLQIIYPPVFLASFLVSFLGNKLVLNCVGNMLETPP